MPPSGSPIKLIDFGSAVSLFQRASQGAEGSSSLDAVRTVKLVGGVSGTSIYWAPEQVLVFYWYSISQTLSAWPEQVRPPRITSSSLPIHL